MNDKNRASLWMIGAIFSFTSMAVAGRKVGVELDTFELMFFRSLIGVGVVLITLTATSRLNQIKFRRLKLHTFRNIAHFAGQNLWFYAIPIVPLATVFALEFTSPIWAVLLAPLLLGERITLNNIIVIVISFIGVLIVTRPFGGAISPGIVAAALAAIGFALSALFTRKLTRTESIASILFLLTLTQTFLGFAFAGWDGDITVPSIALWPWVVAISVAGLTAHLCLTTALSLAPASVVMPVDFLRLPLIVIVGLLFYNEQIDIWVLIGAALIIAGNWINIKSQH